MRLTAHDLVRAAFGRQAPAYPSLWKCTVCRSEAYGYTAPVCHGMRMRNAA